jgi:hypothetical protein
LPIQCLVLVFCCVLICDSYIAIGITVVMLMVI